MLISLEILFVEIFMVQEKMKLIKNKIPGLADDSRLISAGLLPKYVNGESKLI